MSRNQAFDEGSGRERRVVKPRPLADRMPMLFDSSTDAPEGHENYGGSDHISGEVNENEPYRGPIGTYPNPSVRSLEMYSQGHAAGTEEAEELTDQGYEPHEIREAADGGDWVEDRPDRTEHYNDGVRTAMHEHADSMEN